MELGAPGYVYLLLTRSKLTVATMVILLFFFEVANAKLSHQSIDAIGP
jgi:hypothetical protein